MAGFWTKVDAFDARAEARIEPFRNRFWLNELFYGASFLGDHGLIWIVLAVLRYFTGVGGSEAAHFAGIRSVVAEAGQALFVNVGVKSLFRRKRPVLQFDRPYHLRIPRTTSFPSGHATASFTGAVLLSEGTPWGWFLFPLAFLIAFSRIYVRIHHASDVVGGIVIGTLVGLAIRVLVPLP
ncbi:MAG: phosphatase PAP2 family protein [Acidimicrobiales bacterium]|nr:phosphatase PAP2 family protein [Acidimicrobiales bacterium]